MSCTVAVTSVAGAAAVALAYRLRRAEASTPIEEKRARAMAIRTGGAVLWPAVLLAMIPREDRGCPALAVPVVFALLVWMLDSFLIACAPSHTADTPASLRFEAAGLAGLSFGLCSLLGNKPESRHTPLFLYAILGCLVLVLPSHNLAPGCVHEQVFDSVQKAALMWCLGLLIAAVALTRYRACGGMAASEAFQK